MSTSLLRQRAGDRAAGRTIRVSMPATLELRPATDADALALLTIAGRDSAEVPAGPLLIAETAGTPLAAISLATGEVVADPFWPTAAAVDALRRAARAGRPRRRIGRLLRRAERPAAGR